jgi:hypothetical protein
LLLDGSALTQPTGLPFPFQQAQDVALADGSLDVTDDGPAPTLGVHEFDADLGDVPGVPGAAQNTVDLGKLDWLILRLFVGTLRSRWDVRSVVDAYDFANNGVTKERNRDEEG